MPAIIPWKSIEEASEEIDRLRADLAWAVERHENSERLREIEATNTIALRTELAKIQEWRKEDADLIANMAYEITDLMRELAEAKKDSARYRKWLVLIDGGDNPIREAAALRNFAHAAVTLGHSVEMYSCAIRAAIDEAKEE